MKDQDFPSFRAAECLLAQASQRRRRDCRFTIDPTEVLDLVKRAPEALDPEAPEALDPEAKGVKVDSSLVEAWEEFSTFCKMFCPSSGRLRRPLALVVGSQWWVPNTRRDSEASLVVLVVMEVKVTPWANQKSPSPITSSITAVREDSSHLLVDLDLGTMDSSHLLADLALGTMDSSHPMVDLAIMDLEKK